MELLDRISCLIILRALYLYNLLENGWIIKKNKNKNTFDLTKVKIN